MDQTRSVPVSDAIATPIESVQVLDLETGGECSGDWITRLLRSGLFQNLMPEHSHRFFAELEPVGIRAGQVVAEQGAMGEYFYVITQGRCAVTRQVSSTNREVQLNVLREGDTFGEDSLISGTPRTTTVRMLSDGTLMRLERNRFEKLVAAPMLSKVSYGDARKLVDDGALWLDVRENDEPRDEFLEGSLSVPGHVLSIEAAKLDTKKTYIVYCETGAHSATGAFLLTRLGFEAHVLDGGLVQMRIDVRTAVEKKVKAAVSGQTPEDRAPGVSDDVAADAPGADGQVETLREVLESLAREHEGATAGAEHAEERVRVLGRHNSALAQLIRVQRDKHQEVERALERERDARSDELKSTKARLERTREAVSASESAREQLEDLLTQTDERLLDTSGQLNEVRSRLSESDARLTKTLDILAGANERLATTTVKLVDTTEELSSVQARLVEVEHRLATQATVPSAMEEEASRTDSRLAQVDVELADVQAKLAEALSDKVAEQAARARAESALEVALAELQSHVEGLASLRSALTGDAGID